MKEKVVNLLEDAERTIGILMLEINRLNVELNATKLRELTDEEINKLWAESHEDGIAMQQGFTTQQHYFAHLILKKASEK